MMVTPAKVRVVVLPAPLWAVPLGIISRAPASTLLAELTETAVLLVEVLLELLTEAAVLLVELLLIDC